MSTLLDNDDFWSHSNCGCGHCDDHDDLYDDEDVYDDPYDVVMYDITVDEDDLYALFDMLADDDRAWYAKRRLNALAAAGPLSALVADVIIDSLGRRWDPLLHPRDRFGRFINTGGFFRWLMNGVWHRGQVSRIDSDGVIHARSVGNDRVPDGTAYRFRPEQAAKLVSTKAPQASLADVDLDADIPDFPEATDIQKRIYNTLGQGNMPAADLDRSLRDLDLTAQDFTGELEALEERGLIEIDKTGDKPRVRRSDDDNLGVVDVSDDEIADVPDDETPDLDDSPEFTKAQRALLDRIAKADQGDNDGIRGLVGLRGVDQDDLEALINAGALDEDSDGNLYLENPEAKDESNAPVSTPDVGQEIFEAAQGFSDDPDAQEAFQHYAEELARPGDENNIPLPEELPAAKRRNAEAMAKRWWEEHEGITPDADETSDPNVPEAAQANPKDSLNPRNQATADQIAEEYWGDDPEFLDGKQGEEYRGAIKRLLDAEDLEEAGFSAQADAERDKAVRAMRRINVPEEDIDAWPQEIRDRRAGVFERPEEEEALDDVTPELEEELEAPGTEVVGEEESDEFALEEPPVILPGDDFDANAEEPLDNDADGFGNLPEEELPEPAVESTPDWKDFSDRLNEEGPAEDFFDRLTQENRIAEEMGLDLQGTDAPWSWDALAEGIGFRPAELLFNDSGGSLGAALAKDPDQFIRQYENELLEKFQQGSAPGPEVMRLRQAGLIEAAEGGNSWRLTDAGRERLGIVDELPSEEELAVEEVDLPSESELAEGDADVPSLVNPELERLLAEEEAIANAEGETPEFDAAHDRVFQAMMDAQDGEMDRADAYEVAALEVQNGVLRQSDLDDIQNSVREAIEQDGGKWDPDREIDFVGDDQRAPDAPAAPLFVPEPEDLVDAADKPAFAKVTDQTGFLENKPDVEREGEVLDRNGQRVVLGGWYKANKGGEGDPDQVIGFLRQDRYPGWVLMQAPDGKLKAVNAKGKGRQAGINRMPDPGTEQRENIRVQRAVGGKELLDLDQNNPKNVLFGGQRAEVGMRVRGRGQAGQFNESDEGVIVRIGWNAGQNRPNIFVIKPGAAGQSDELQLAPRRLVPVLEGTPTAPPTPETQTPDAPNLDPNNLPNREWPVPSDQEMVDRLQQLGGEVDLVNFVNAHVAPGVVYDQVQSAIDRGELEMVPGQGDIGPRLRVPGGGQGVPEAELPDGAEDEFEAAVLNAIDAAEAGGVRKADLVNLDDDDAGDKLLALRALRDRGVLRERLDPDGGAPLIERVEVTPGPELPIGAQNELEADLLNAIDGTSSPLRAGDLIDLDADDAAEKAEALRVLVDRRVLRRSIDPDTGKPVYSRPESGGSTPVSMSNDEAARALASGADPVLVVTDNLEQVMRDAGYKFILNGQRGISDNFWAISPQSAPFPVRVRSDGATKEVSGKVYMVKRSAGHLIANDVLNEVMAGAISEGLRERLGSDAPGLLHHPRVVLAAAPKGLGTRAGGAILMEHAAYGFPEDHILYGGLDLRGESLFDGGASEDIIGLALYDYLINNTVDRHRNNQMYVEDPNTGKIRAVVIDNGFGFGASGGKENLTFRKYANMARPSALLERAKSREAGRDRVENAVRQFTQTYQQMDVEAMMERIKTLFPTMTPEQEAYVRQHLTIAKNRVDSLATNIDDVVDAIMNL